MKSYLIAGLDFWADEVLFRKPFPAVVHHVGQFLCSLQKLQVLSFRSFSHLETGFVQGDRYRYNFILLHVDAQFFSAPLLTMLSFLPHSCSYITFILRIVREFHTEYKCLMLREFLGISQPYAFKHRLPYLIAMCRLNVKVYNLSLHCWWNYGRPRLSRENV